MNKTNIRIIAVLIMAIGLFYTSCSNPPGGVNGGDDPLGSIYGPTVYDRVTAMDEVEFKEYLTSTTVPYEITLNLEGSDIYLDTDLSITMPMRIKGDPNKIYTLHTYGSNGVLSYFCIDIAANLELQYCNLIAYNETILASGQDVPPLMVRAGSILTIGKGASLIFEDFEYSMPYSDGTVKVGDGGLLYDKSLGGGKVFNCGASSLIIYPSGTAILSSDMTAGSQETDHFQILDGFLEIWRIDDVTTYVVDGAVNLNNDWILPDEQILHVKSGRLSVSEGRNFYLTAAMGGVVLDGNIELSKNAGLDLSEYAEEVLEKVTGSGYITVEDVETGSIYKGSIAFIGGGNNFVFKLSSPGSRIELSGEAISLVNGEVEYTYGPGTYDLEKRFVINAGAKLIIVPGASLRAPLRNKLEGTAAKGASKSIISIIDGAAFMVYPGDDPYYPDIPDTGIPIDLEWNNNSGKWVVTP